MVAGDKGKQRRRFEGKGGKLEVSMRRFFWKLGGKIVFNTKPYLLEMPNFVRLKLSLFIFGGFLFSPMAQEFFC